MPADPLEQAQTLREVRAAMRGAEHDAVPILWRSLRREMPRRACVAALLEVQIERLRGRPFHDLPPPSNIRDRLSREQVGPLVLVVRAVRKRRGADAALRVGRAVARAGAMGFLDRMVPEHDRATLRLRPEALANELLGRFFNAEGTVRRQGDEAAIDVTACHFVELLSRIGEAKLAPLMCEADLSFFDGKRRLIRLVRTQTLAEGAPRCDFVFRLDP